MANRHLSRSIAMQSLYEWDFWGKDKSRLKEAVEKNIKEFGPGMEGVDFIWRLVNGVVENLEKLDQKFQTQKYHSAAVRMEIVRQAFLAEARMMESAKKLVFSPHDGYKNPDASILIGIG